MSDSSTQPQTQHSDKPFIVGLGIIAGTYVLLLVGLIAADVAFVARPPSSVEGTQASGERRPSMFHRVQTALQDEKIQYSIKLTLVSCFFTAILSVLMAVPIGYFLSRFRFPGRSLIDAILDIPIVLPPLVVGLSLLIPVSYTHLTLPTKA